MKENTSEGEKYFNDEFYYSSKDGLFVYVHIREKQIASIRFLNWDLKNNLMTNTEKVLTITKKISPEGYNWVDKNIRNLRNPPQLPERKLEG